MKIVRYHWSKIRTYLMGREKCTNIRCYSWFYSSHLHILSVLELRHKTLIPFLFSRRKSFFIAVHVERIFIKKVSLNVAFKWLRRVTLLEWLVPSSVWLSLTPSHLTDEQQGDKDFRKFSQLSNARFTIKKKNSTLLYSYLEMLRSEFIL